MSFKTELLCPFLILSQFSIWAATWQNQQSECAPSENSDQSRHTPSLISLRCALVWVAKDPSFLHADSKDSDQTGTLIWVFAGRTVTLLVLSCRCSFLVHIGTWSGSRFCYLSGMDRYLNQFMRLWHFSSSVNSFFKRAYSNVRHSSCFLDLGFCQRVTFSVVFKRVSNIFSVVQFFYCRSTALVIHKNCLMHPDQPTLNHTTQTFLALLGKLFLPHFH